MKYQITVNQNSYEVEILDDPRLEEVQVKVNNETFTVITSNPSSSVTSPTPIKTATPVAKQTPSAAAQTDTGGKGTVKSPLPGTVNAIKVSSGQRVKANDELCVIEAMKAMNVIRAQREGTIGTIYVTLGENVAYGAPLMDIE